MLAGIGSLGKALARPWSCRGRGQRRPGQVTGVFGAAVALAIALSACTSAQPSGSAAAEGSQPVSAPGTSCAWPTELSAQANNTAFPDAAAAYWVQPIVASAGTRIVLSGRFPDARYASVDLPLPPGTTSRHPGYLIYRVYLPAGGNFSAVPPPVLTVEQGGAARTLPACRSHNAPVILPAAAPAAGGSGAAAPPPPQLEFYKPPQSTFNNAGLANVDTAYALAYLIRPPAADVVVVTAKAPTFAPGSHPSPWPARGEDVRYWSMCIGLGISHIPIVANKLPGGVTDYGCRADEATRLNAAGDYTYVIGSESQRAAISRIAGVTFLPFATAHPGRLYVLGLRNTLVSASFKYSPQDITQANVPAAAAAVMGPYYPHIAACALTTLMAKGPQACR